MKDPLNLKWLQRLQQNEVVGPCERSEPKNTFWNNKRQVWSVDDDPDYVFWWMHRDENQLQIVKRVVNSELLIKLSTRIQYDNSKVIVECYFLCDSEVFNKHNVSFWRVRVEPFDKKVYNCITISICLSFLVQFYIITKALCSVR